MNLVLFDLDGTLVDLAPPREQLEALREELLALAEIHAVGLDTTSIFPMYQRLADEGLGEPASEAIARYEVRWAEMDARRLYLPQTRPLLEALAVRAALVTSNGRACVEALRARGILDVEFPVVVAREDVRALKPSAEPLRAAVGRLAGSAPVTVRFVGDSAADEDAWRAFAAIHRRPGSGFMAVGERGISIDRAVAELLGRTSP